MTDSKSLSPLAHSVLVLDTHFSELIRLGSKIDNLDMKSDSDFEQAEKLMKHFAEHGEGVATQVVQMSRALNEARAQAEAAAKLVGVRAEQLQLRKTEEQKKMEAFRLLGEKVRELTIDIATLKSPENTEISTEDKNKMSLHLALLESQLKPLIEEATLLRKEAHSSKMRMLEQSADSLSQSLLAVSKRISNYQQLN